jgi:hypothetical protein
MSARQRRPTFATVAALVLVAPLRLAASDRAGSPADAASTLSVLQDAGAECHWFRWDPVAGRQQQVARFDFKCDFPSLAWSYDGRRALVMLSKEPKDTASPWISKLWLVDLEKGTQQPLKLPPSGRVDRIGFDRNGVAHALTLEDAAEETAGAETPPVHFLRWKGQNVVRPAEFKGAGEPCLAHDFTLTLAGEWRHDDVRYTRTGSRLSPRTEVLPVAKELGPTSWDVDFALFPWVEVDDPTVKTTLEGVQASTDDRRWMRLGQIQPPVFGLVDDSITPANVGDIVVLDGSKVRVISKAEHGVAYVRMPYLLIDRQATQLYDLRASRVVWSRDGLHQAIFWPTAEPQN